MPNFHIITLCVVIYLFIVTSPFLINKSSLLIFYIFSGIAFSVDTDLKETEKAFESEFNKIYFDPADEKAAGAYLIVMGSTIHFFLPKAIFSEFKKDLQK